MFANSVVHQPISLQAQTTTTRSCDSWWMTTTQYSYTIYSSNIWPYGRRIVVHRFCWPKACRPTGLQQINTTTKLWNDWARRYIYCIDKMTVSQLLDWKMLFYYQLWCRFYVWYWHGLQLWDVVSVSSLGHWKWYLKTNVCDWWTKWNLASHNILEVWSVWGGFRLYLYMIRNHGEG